MLVPRSVLATLATLVLLSMGGVFVALTGPMHHDMGCPFMPGHEVQCAGPLEHLSHWQSSFLMIVAEILALFAFLFLAFRNGLFWEIDVGPPGKIFLRSVSPYRPTLFQELFSKGILNRKESYCFV